MNLEIWLQAIGHALAHSLWQIALVALLLAALRWRFPLLLLTIPAAFLLTLFRLLSVPAAPVGGAANAGPTIAPAAAPYLPDAPWDWAAIAAIAWLAGAAILSFRAFGGWLLLRRHIRRARPLMLANWKTCAPG